MSYTKKELLELPLEERRELASDLIDSILAEEMQPVPNWKREFIQQRVALDDANPGGGIKWSELRKKYFQSSLYSA